MRTNARLLQLLGRSLILATGLVTLGGCNTFTNWFPPPAPTMATQLRVADAQRVMSLQSCPVSGGSVIQPQVAPLALAALAIPYLIDVGAKVAAQEVQRAQDNLTASYVAYPTPRETANVGCIVVIRGRFGETTEAIPTQGRLDNATLRSLGAVAQPSLYAEISVTRSSDGKHLQLWPKFVQFNDTAARNPGDGTKSVGLFLAFAGTPLTAPAGSQPQDVAKVADLVVPFSFGRLPRGSWIHSEGNDPQRQHLLLEQVKTLRVTDDNGRQLLSSLSAYAFVTESSDPAFFDRLLLAAAQDNGFADALKKIYGAATGRS